jgi:hypothetical protein
VHSQNPPAVAICKDQLLWQISVVERPARILGHENQVGFNIQEKKALEVRFTFRKKKIN